MEEVMDDMERKQINHEILKKEKVDMIHQKL